MEKLNEKTIPAYIEKWTDIPEWERRGMIRKHMDENVWGEELMREYIPGW